jgi:hypothetical protein
MAGSFLVFQQHQDCKLKVIPGLLDGPLSDRPVALTDMFSSSLSQPFSLSPQEWALHYLLYIQWVRKKKNVVSVDASSFSNMILSTADSLGFL